jgi:AhpD family alkylhydroperoxidase
VIDVDTMRTDVPGSVSLPSVTACCWTRSMRHAGQPDIVESPREPTRGLRRAVPEVWTAFTGLHAAAVADGALPGRIKELMALVLAVGKPCDGCIADHARAVARAGASPEEVAEALGVALLMDGGPATVYGPRAWAAIEEFRQELAPAT